MTKAAQVAWIGTSSSHSGALGLRRPAVRAGASSPEPVRRDERHPAAAVLADVLGSDRAPALSGTLVEAGAGPTLWRAGSAEGRCATDRAHGGGGHRRPAPWCATQSLATRAARPARTAAAEPRNADFPLRTSGWAAVRAREVLPAPDIVRRRNPRARTAACTAPFADAS